VQKNAFYEKHSLTEHNKFRQLGASLNKGDGGRDSSFESVSRAETISEIGFGVGASEKAKRSSEGLAVIGSIVNRGSERRKRR
jgi:hypothetical protein